MTTDDSYSTEAQQFWEDLYGKQERVWSGNPNAVLVRSVVDLTPGTALDLGCGEGADAIWLAQHGWRVTAVDVSPTALRRAEVHAESVGVGGNIEWQPYDLTVSFPQGTFDLVTAQFLHSPIEFPRERVLQAASGAVAPGGHLLIVGHGEIPPWGRHDHPEVTLPTPQEVLETLHLEEQGWQIDLQESPSRDVIGPDGEPAVLKDSVLMVSRVAG